MTGRAAGYCAGYGVAGYMNPQPGGFIGRGFGRGPGRGAGRGAGRYWRPFYQAPLYPEGYNYPQPSQQEERRFLEEQSRALQEQLEDIKQRLDEMAVEQADTKS
jgi:hypothetical protein